MTDSAPPKVIDRAKIGRRNRAKGAVFERDVAKVVLDHTGLKLKRELRQTAERERGDLVDETGAFPFMPECKTSTGAKFLTEWYWQAQTAADKAGLYPVVVYRIAGRPMRARIPSVVFGEIYRGVPVPAEEPVWSHWVDMAVDSWCSLAVEIMAERALRAAA